ncbi:hypothetical protein F2Q69_00037808 [Brassica cretica]|uniref:EH domain-containing protein 1 n=1 Tax=Brassica cretica TaxID=69181 RepID=A0A8S9SK97_BRACR|nr:hypothetical protein F2Q69_00037808 [Brassica cretica]
MGLSFRTRVTFGSGWSFLVLVVLVGRWFSFSSQSVCWWVSLPQQRALCFEFAGELVLEYNQGSCRSSSWFKGRLSMPPQWPPALPLHFEYSLPDSLACPFSGGVCSSVRFGATGQGVRRLQPVFAWSGIVYRLVLRELFSAEPISLRAVASGSQNYRALTLGLTWFSLLRQAVGHFLALLILLPSFLPPVETKKNPLSEMEIDSVAAGSCSKENQLIYKEWFEFADSDGDGRITGSDAIKFFSMSNLPRPELKQVWAIADAKRQGYLGFKDFIVAMQLVSLAQTGHEISHDVLHSDVDFKNMNPPVMEGLGVLMAKKQHSSSKSSDLNVNGSPSADASLTAHWFSSKSSKKISLSSVTSIVDGLKRLYIQKLKPLEVAYRFNDFVSPLLTNSDFDAKPMVMLLGAHIGPEPTTDRFVVVMSGPDERSIPGNTVAVQADMPFSGLTTFGTAFLSKFECSQMPHPLLEHVAFVDTPGVLSGEKQRTQRAYDFTGVTSWFASKCDLILLLFDPHKLDVSDEFKRVISSLRGHDDKIRVVLNKADQVDTQQLMRVYGALMWSLGKVLNTPEVSRVYIGSFSDKPINEAATGPIGRELFEKEQDDLLADLKDIPKKACDRRINEFVKRARAAKIHACIISHLKKEMPAIMGKAKAQQKLVDNLEDVFGKVQREHHLPKGDFPNVEQFREVLCGYNIDKFEKLKPKMLQTVDDMLGYDIPELLKNFRNPYD